MRRESSHLEAHLERDLKAVGITSYEREKQFVPGRRFRADFFFPRQKLILEVDGGTWSGGRHTRGAGYENDCRKQCLAAILGYRYMRVTAAMIEKGEAIAMIEKALEKEGE